MGRPKELSIYLGHHTAVLLIRHLLAAPIEIQNVLNNNLTPIHDYLLE